MKKALYYIGVALVASGATLWVQTSLMDLRNENETRVLGTVFLVIGVLLIFYGSGAVFK